MTSLMIQLLTEFSVLDNSYLLEGFFDNRKIIKYPSAVICGDLGVSV